MEKEPGGLLLSILDRAVASTLNWEVAGLTISNIRTIVGQYLSQMS